jgi:thioredoxin reductase (NADPH)
MYDTLMKFEPDYKYGNVQSVELDGDEKVVKTDDDKEYRAPILIIATGSDHRHLNVPGEEEYSGRGVSYCAVCDAAFFKDEDVVVIGGGDSAIEEGIYLSQLAKSVTVVHRRDKLRAQPTLQKRAFANKKMKFVWNAQTEEILGDGTRVTGIKCRDKETGVEKEIKAAGVFIYVGVLPQTKPFENLGILNEQGWIPTNEHMETKVPGIFALGDVRDKDLRQIANAVGEGSVAGQAAYNYYQDLKD